MRSHTKCRRKGVPSRKGVRHFVQLFLAFRDRLRADPEATRAYAALKRELAERHRHERELYTRAKAEFIQGVLSRR